MRVRPHPSRPAQGRALLVHGPARTPRRDGAAVNVSVRVVYGDNRDMDLPESAEVVWEDVVDASDGAQIHAVLGLMIDAGKRKRPGLSSLVDAHDQLMPAPMRGWHP